jgi:nucleotide-binding universal stress UspA family protein
MYRNLVVPLDGSAFAEHALPFAASIARRAGATLQVVQAHVPVAAFYGGIEQIGGLTLDATVREIESTYRDDIVRRLAECLPVPASHTLVNGPIADTLYEHAVGAAADLVVMATHGRGPWSRFWLGSVADRLVRRLPMPILLVRPQEQTANLAQDQVIRRILVPLDGSDLAERVLGPAIALGSLMQAEYMLLQVVQPMSIAGYDTTNRRVSGINESLVMQLQAIDRQKLAEAQDYLEKVAAQLRARSLNVHTRVVAHEQPAVAIIEGAQKYAADLIALATHGRGGLKRLFLGSIADKVVRAASTPVLVCRPAPERATS